MSAPFFAKEFTFTQPDGTSLPVKGWGDQHYARFETIDGYSVIEDPVSGAYQYATLTQGILAPSGIQPGKISTESLPFQKGLKNTVGAIKSLVRLYPGLPPSNSRWKERWQERKVAAQLPKMPMAPPKHTTTGNYTGLCLLIQFPDVAGSIDKTVVESFCNEPGYNGFGNNGSVYDYYLENSGGKLTYNNVVANYYTAKNPRDYYTNKDVPQPIRAIELITEALEDLKTKGFDFEQLTSDAIDYVYAVNVFYAGDVVNGWAKGLWPHSWHLNNPLELAPGKNAYDYQISNMGNELSLATFCHENGHMICDFPDLYDYGYESSGIGGYCLMCGGGLADPKNPTNICAYLKYKAGWAYSATELSGVINAAITSAQNVFFLARNNVKEYFIIENRQKTGRDASLPDDGLTIWHVDEDGNNENEQMTPLKHYECALMQADGKNELEGGVNQGNAGDLFKAPLYTQFGPNTNPSSNWWIGVPSRLTISNISASAEDMTFNAQF